MTESSLLIMDRVSWIRKKLEEMKAEFEPLTKLMKEACEGRRVLGFLDL